MTAAQFELIDETEAEAILRWRFEELVRSGYDIGSALVLASHVEIDLHDASSLTHKAARQRQLCGFSSSEWRHQKAGAPMRRGTRPFLCMRMLRSPSMRASARVVPRL